MSSPEDSATIEHKAITEGEEGTQQRPVWDPVAQIYVGGIVPGENAAVREMIRDNDGYLRLFGYGSLCWNPGTGALADSSVRHALGRARLYRRCWAQRSTDHRGRPTFPGIVCTLLREDEFQQYRPSEQQGETESSMTEGIIYTVPPNLVDECLAELDFREKGGYARDIVNVVEDESGEAVRALLYRGTPDNPAFWPRALRDLPFAAAIMSVAEGPSGANNVYLDRLDNFLEDAGEASTLEKFDDTFRLAAIAKTLKEHYQVSFLFGCGSNQHNQLLLRSDNNAADLRNGEDAHDLKDIVLCTAKPRSTGGRAIRVFAGGGHSGLLTEGGDLHLFGWNESGQLGSSGGASRESLPNKQPTAASLPVISELKNIRVQTAALGFSHTLVIERDTGRLLSFGDNSRGQVTGTIIDSDTEAVHEPLVPKSLEKDCMAHVAAGLFHSAAITSQGELITFGCCRRGQCLEVTKSESSAVEATGNVGRWKPPDGSRLVKVACGRQHTVVLDERGRIWTLGDNKYGQLGREASTNDERRSTPELVQCKDWETDDLRCVDIQCGWSHTVALLDCSSGGDKRTFGWGRNDKGQLGAGSASSISDPTRLFHSKCVQSIACGSESTIVVDTDGELWSCGWNEHGNLSVGDNVDARELVKMRGTPITTAPGYPLDATRLDVAAGGAHVLVMKVLSQ